MGLTEAGHPPILLGQRLDNEGPRDVARGREQSRADLEEMNPMKALNVVTTALLVVGGLNWGLVGLFDFDLVAALFGPMSFLSRAVYGLVGLSALYQAVAWRGVQRRRMEPTAARA